MPKKLKSYLDDDEFRAKRVFLKFENKQNNFYKGPAGYKRAIKKSNYFSSQEQYKKNTQVIVKITGNDGTFKKLKSHIRYITRNGEIGVYTSFGEIISGKENLKEIWDNFNKDGYRIPTEKELFTNCQKEKRETLHLVFSMKDYTNASMDQIRLAAMETIKQKYPNNYFVLAMHNDTAHPHCHLVLKTRDVFGRRIDPKKKDLDDLRKNFVLELNKLGVEASTRIKHKYDDKEQEINTNIITVSDKNLWSKNKQNHHKPHYYQIVSFGQANYKFNPANESSYYVRYRTSKGKDIDIWANDLERVVTENNLKIGEYARLAITGEQAYEKTIYDKKTKRSYKKTIYKKTWDISVEGRAEKILKPLKKFSKPMYEIINNAASAEIENNVEKLVVADNAPSLSSNKIHKIQSSTHEVKNKNFEME